MTEYAIVFDDEWVREHTDEEITVKAVASRAVVDQMRAADVLVWTNGGLGARDFVATVTSDGGPAEFSDEPWNRGDHLGGICVIDVPDDDAARQWAGRLSVALQWPQEIHRFRGPGMRA